MSARPWVEVKHRAEQLRHQLANSLITAELDRIQETQVRIQIIDQFIAWFEAGAPEDMMMDTPSVGTGY